MPTMCKKVDEGERHREGNNKNQDRLRTLEYQK